MWLDGSAPSLRVAHAFCAAVPSVEEEFQLLAHSRGNCCL